MWYILKETGQIERVIERDKNTRELAEKIIDAQMAFRRKSKKKKKKADIVINNNSTLEYLKNQVNVIYCNLQKNKKCEVNYENSSSQQEIWRDFMLL